MNEIKSTLPSLPPPTSDSQWYFYIIAVVFIVCFFIWTKYGKNNNAYNAIKTKKEKDIGRLQSFLAVDDQRIKQLESSDIEQWEAIGDIEKTHSEFAQELMGLVGEIRGQLNARK